MASQTGSGHPLWQRLRSHLLADRWPWLRLWADDLQLPGGRHVDGYLRLESRDYASIIAVTPGGQVPLLRQFKYGPGAVVLEVPAGYLEDGEAPLAGAQRELLEETGYQAGTWEHLGSFYVDGNRGFGRAHLFLARDARPVQPPAAGDLEEMELQLIPLDQLWQLIRVGDICGLAPAAVAALALLRLHPTLSS